jgi:Zn-dependent protease with chaperone function
VTVVPGALSVLAAALVVAAPHALGRAGWAAREPRAALVLWQALGLASGVAAVGALLVVGLAPLGATVPAAVQTYLSRLAAGDPTAALPAGRVAALLAGAALLGWLLAATAVSARRTWRTRDRQRELVDLLSTAWPPRPSPARPTGGPARVIDHPVPTAYCLPGQHPRVVITTGALRLLSPEELDAVLAHEHAHLAERHDLVVLPFAAWSAALRWLPAPRVARATVERLVEMVADDRACVGRDRGVLASALARLGAATGPGGSAAVPAMTGDAPAALGSAGQAVLPRVRRLLAPPRRSRPVRLVAYAAALAVLLLPPAVALLPPVA